MLIKHCRDVNRVPYATIVAISATEVGVAIGHSRRPYNKKLMIEIATGRARKHGEKRWYECIDRVPVRFIKVAVDIEEYDGKQIPHGEEIFSLVNAVCDEVEDMKERAKKYFKPMDADTDQKFFQG